MGHFLLLASTGLRGEGASSRLRLVNRALADGMIELSRGAAGVLLVDAHCSYTRVLSGEADTYVIGEAVEREYEAGPLPGRNAGIEAVLGSLWGDFTCIAVRTWPEPQVEIAPSLFGPSRVFVAEPAPDLRLYASSLDLLLRLLEDRPTIDAAELSAFLVRSTFPRRRSCLAGIEQLLPGTVDRCASPGASTRVWWDPWRFTPARRTEGWRDTSEDLRRLIMDSVTKSVSGDRPLLELSGGFDSSVLAHCMGEAGLAFEAVTLVSSAADGDERHYARIAADHAGVRLTEIQMHVDDVEILRPPEIRTVQPGPHILAQHMDREVMSAAENLGCDTFVSGGGGDNIFFATFSVVPIVDLWRDGRSLGATWQAVHDVARITDVAQIEVAARAIYRSWWRDRNPRWELETDFLSHALRGAPDVQHPWLDHADLRRPGTARHVRSLIGILPCLDGYARGALGGLKFPLLSRPIVEHCLGVPTWEWIRGGRDRAYARRAFDGFIPGDLLARRRKGALDGMFAQLFNANRQVIRDHLLGGYLAGQGLLDADAIERYLSSKSVLTDKHYYRLIELAGYENWCRLWS